MSLSLFDSQALWYTSVNTFLVFVCRTLGSVFVLVCCVFVCVFVVFVFSCVFVSCVSFVFVVCASSISFPWTIHLPAIPQIGVQVKSVRWGVSNHSWVRIFVSFAPVL